MTEKTLDEIWDNVPVFEEASQEELSERREETEKNEKILLEKYGVSGGKTESGGEYFTTFSADQKTVFLYKIVDSL